MESVLPMRRRSHGSIRSPLVKRDSQSLVVIEGCLHKLEGGALKQWKRRWCVLADFCLFFYKGPNEDKVFSSVLLPSYKINPCCTEDRISRKFAFKAEHHNMKTYYFAAESSESMKRWMNAMSLASIMQNVGRGEKFESLVSHTSNDDEDSGFTSYRSRRYGGPDHNSSFDSNHGSEHLKQRSNSCGDRMGEMYLGSDDKYPSVFKNPQSHLYKSSSVERNIPQRQPLYANAPPKPRRLTLSDPYTIAPSEQYDFMGYDGAGLATSPYHFQEMPDDATFASSPNGSYLMYTENMPPVDHASAHRFSNEMIFPETLPAQYGEAFPHGENMRSMSDLQDQSTEPPRPHSADFLERDTECISVIPRNLGDKPQPQRPKSSLEFYNRYWDSEDYGFDDYREAVRTQADNLYTNKNLLQPERTYRRQKQDVAKSEPKFRVPYNENNFPVTTNERVSRPPKSKQHNREKYNSRYEEMSQSLYHINSGDQYLPISHTKKKKSHEESMRRLLEWKQRMLQSPLTKRTVQHSTSSSEAGSPKMPPMRPPLPNEYREQVIQELESHEARLRRYEMITNETNESQHNHNVKDHQNISTTYPEENTYYGTEINECYEGPKLNETNGYHTRHNIENELNFTDLANLSESPPKSQSQIYSEKITCDASNENKVMYCVDSENNEILIYGDNYEPELPKLYEAESNFQNHQNYCANDNIEATTSWGTNVHHSEVDSVQHSSLQNISFQPSENTFISQDSTLSSSTAYRFNTCYSSDDEASIDTDYRKKRGTSRSQSSYHRAKNVSDSEIHVREPSHLKKLVQQSEGLMSKGKRLSISAGDLLGKTHEELVLLLIQLRRNQARIARAKEKCLQQLENDQQLNNMINNMDENMKQVYSQSFNELKRQIAQLEKQYEVTRPLVNLVDNMVKLGSLYGNSEKRSSSFPHLDIPSDALNISQEEIHAINFPSDPQKTMVWEEENELQGHLNEIYCLDKGLRQETHSFSSLQQDKEMLECTLHGMKNKILDHQDKPIELQKLRKQQRMIEKELIRVKRLLSHSAKKIEDATTKNDQLEQEILLLRQKLQQALKTGSCEMKASNQSRADLEAELTRVQTVLEELANHRQEINNTVEKLKNEARSKISLCSTKVRASPTGVAGSAPLPLRKKQLSTYLETDLDTMETLDLSTIGRDADDIPVYVNAEEINNPNQETFTHEASQPQECPAPFTEANSEKEDLSQCPLQDMNDADERMKRFYGILPREKCEIKTVRIVKRQSERRNRGRDKKRVTYGDQSSVWVVEEPDFSSDDHLETDEESFKRAPSSFYTRPTSIQLPTSSFHKQSGSQSAHERLFGSSSSGRVEEETAMPCSSNRIRRSKRRHYTVSGCQYLMDPQFTQFLRDRPRSRDDVDMERCLRTANTPDIVRSTIKKNEVFDDKIIDRELGLPQKISIPERYIEDEPEQLSASERLRRSLKAENIRKMLSETTATYEDVKDASEGNGGQPGTLHKKMNEEKRKRAHLLALNQVIAREVMERSKAVAANVCLPDSQSSS